MQFGFDDDNLNEERKNTEPTEKAKEGVRAIMRSLETGGQK